MYIHRGNCEQWLLHAVLCILSSELSEEVLVPMDGSFRGMEVACLCSLHPVPHRQNPTCVCCIVESKKHGPLKPWLLNPVLCIAGSSVVQSLAKMIRL